MRWKRALDKLPTEDQEVLVRYKATVHLAAFDLSRKVFLLKDGSTFDPLKDELQWMELDRTSSSRQNGKF